MNIEILSLNESLVPNVKSLIAGYINSSSNKVDEEYIIKNLSGG